MLKDLYPTSSGGDLAVTIQESDGSQTQYTLPFASVPNLVRNGQVKYALGAGKYRPAGNQISPSFAQGELFWAGDTASRFMAGRSFPIATPAAFGIGQNLGRFGAYSRPHPCPQPAG